MKAINTYTALGLMSGTSLDGLDIALCTFTKKKDTWHYIIEDTRTFSYSKTWKAKLQTAHALSAQEFWKLHIDFGKFSAQTVHRFLKSKKQHIDLIASHGHTVFHQPQNGFTCQIGDGAALAALTRIPTICDFRSTDLALGGQGAPLVPIGDELLFTEYDACLNVGGIANISFKEKKERIAFDVCPANLVFNFYAAQAEMPYDKAGKLAQSGRVNQTLLKELNALSFYKKMASKSLGREWIDEYILALLEKQSIFLNDKLATAVEHSALQIARVLNHFKLKNLLITGGGAYNTYFIERIKQHTNCQLIIPDDKTIQFKEALVFAFLGVLRLLNETNCLKTVTGASSNSCSGALYLG